MRWVGGARAAQAAAVLDDSVRQVAPPPFQLARRDVHDAAAGTFLEHRPVGIGHLSSCHMPRLNHLPVIMDEPRRVRVSPYSTERSCGRSRDQVRMPILPALAVPMTSVCEPPDGRSGQAIPPLQAGRQLHRPGGRLRIVESGSQAAVRLSGSSPTGCAGTFLRMSTMDWSAAARSALDVSADAGDLSGHAAAHLSLPDLYRRLGRYEPSITHVHRALELAGEAGWADGESVALGNLGNAYAESDRAGGRRRGLRTGGAHR